MDALVWAGVGAVVFPPPTARGTSALRNAQRLATGPQLMRKAVNPGAENQTQL